MKLELDLDKKLPMSMRIGTFKVLNILRNSKINGKNLNIQLNLTKDSKQDLYLVSMRDITELLKSILNLIMKFMLV
jgi:hypothetical protein